MSGHEVSGRIARKPAGRVLYKNRPLARKYFFVWLKNFPQEIENTREIIENMSEIF